ncbi:hypothetical protein BDB00DRAFT_846892 [Zychaea mexicana]|uniref:uncharacterized protein n=1 Tax=Zychaea mexicana TaxID=64656 RepID=UPI0022FEAB9C|nr:uncharacterized protein BDB00DRAFT_846892 [Zychaea mexicana]KAI9488766.1 hypothetical protein BDB00DRAFT_846892 [Zychaea mexicana]
MIPQSRYPGRYDPFDPSYSSFFLSTIVTITVCCLWMQYEFRGTSLGIVRRSGSMMVVKRRCGVIRWGWHVNLCRTII